MLKKIVQLLNQMSDQLNLTGVESNCILAESNRIIRAESNGICAE